MARLGGVQQRQQRQALGEINYVPKITVDRDHFERKEESERERGWDRERGIRELVRQMGVMR